MKNRIGTVAMALVLAAGVFGVRLAGPSEALAIGPCLGASQYATFYENESGGGNGLNLCPTNSGWASLTFGSPGCAGVAFSNNTDWNDCFTSVRIVGMSGTERVCIYSGSAYGGYYGKLGNGTWGFNLFQWEFKQYTNPSNSTAQDNISSVRWCTA